MKQKSKVRTWGGLPIVEAKHELRVFASEEDAVGAVEKDWAHCVFAKACGRLFHSRKVAFFRSIAYVELEKPDGSRCIERFTISKEMKKKIKQFDETHIPPSGGFLLKPPYRTLDDKANDNKSRREAERKRSKARKMAALLGHVEDPSKAPNRSPDVKDLLWRNGMGMVHFTNGKGIKNAKKK